MQANMNFDYTTVEKGFLYKARMVYNGEVSETKPISLGQALTQAQQWADSTPFLGCRITILRASAAGENAGKYFLYQIIRP